MYTAWKISMCPDWKWTHENHLPSQAHNHKSLCALEQLGAVANFDDLVKFGDHRQIRRSQMFIKLEFEFGCDIILMSPPIKRSLGSKLQQTSIFAMKNSFLTNQTDAVW